MAGCRLRGVGAAVSLLLPTLAASILPLVRGGSRSGVARYVGRLHPNHAWVPPRAHHSAPLRTGRSALGARPVHTHRGSSCRAASGEPEFVDACFKSDRLGEAILWYERARLLSPRDEDIGANLHFASRVSKDRESDAGENPVWRFLVGRTSCRARTKSVWLSRFYCLSLSAMGGRRLWNSGGIDRYLRSGASAPTRKPHGRRGGTARSAPDMEKTASSSSTRALRCWWREGRGRGSSSVWPAGLGDGYWRRKLRSSEGDSGAACRPGKISLS